MKTLKTIIALAIVFSASNGFAARTTGNVSASKGHVSEASCPMKASVERFDNTNIKVASNANQSSTRTGSNAKSIKD